MRLAKYRLSKAVLATVATSGASIGIMQGRATAATQEYFDTNGTAAGYGITSGATYNWDDANWANGTAGGTTATTAWVNDGTGFARFYSGPTGATYTITVAQDEKMAGLYLNYNLGTTTGITINIVQKPSTTGDLNVSLNTVAAPWQGFLLSAGATTSSLAAYYGNAVVISAPIKGAGGIEQEVDGSLALYGSNSFTGGFLSTGGQVTNYNNATSFGTGTVSFQGSATSVQGIVTPNGESVTANPITIANPVTFAPTAATASTGVNFVSGHTATGGPGAIWSGNVQLYTSGTDTIDPGQVGDVTELSGNISGGAGIKINDPGTLILAGSNSYTGGTAISKGELVISNDNNVGGPSTELDINGGILGIAGNSLTDYGAHTTLTGFGGGGFDIQSATNTYVYEPVIGGTTGLSKIGAGTLVLTSQSSAASYSGTLSVLAGTLVLRGDNADSEVFSSGTGVNVQTKLVFDYTTPVPGASSTDPSAEVLSALTSGYHESPKFSTATDPLFINANSNTSQGLGWKDDGTQVTVMKTVYGDANLDGTVNALDFNAFATNYGKTPGSDVWVQGDFNYDGSVDSNDFAILAANYGKTLASSGDIPDDGSLAEDAQSLGSVVPEPGSLTLLALGSAAMSIRRRRR